MLIKDYDFICNIDVMFESNIVIYGAGRYGEKCAQLLADAGVEFDCFCDKDEAKKQYLNHPVITLEELQDKAKNQECMIVIGSTEYCEEMIDELNTRNISAYICTWYGIQAGIQLHIEDKRFPKWFQQDIIHKRKIHDFRVGRLWLRAKRLWSLPNAILVYQSPKTGSTTMQTTLQNAEIASVQLHHLFPATGVEELDEAYAYLVQKFRRDGVKIITVARDQIAWALSLFMEQFIDEIVTTSIIDYDLEAEAPRWMTELLKDNEESTWFDKEIKKATGVDIYQYPFDKERGYVWIKEGNIEILLLKLEMLSKNTAIIGEFVGKPGIELVTSHVGAEKNSKYIYAELKKQIRIPAELLDSQYKNNKYMDHFYTEEEKAQFRKKWSSN